MCLSPAATGICSQTTLHAHLMRVYRDNYLKCVWPVVDFGHTWLAVASTWRSVEHPHTKPMDGKRSNSVSVHVKNITLVIAYLTEKRKAAHDGSIMIIFIIIIF